MFLLSKIIRLYNSKMSFIFTLFFNKKKWTSHCFISFFKKIKV